MIRLQEATVFFTSVFSSSMESQHSFDTLGPSRAFRVPAKPASGPSRVWPDLLKAGGLWRVLRPLWFQPHGQLRSA